MKKNLRTTVFLHLSPEATVAALEKEAARIRQRGNQASLSFSCLRDGSVEGKIEMELRRGESRPIKWRGAVVLQPAWSPNYTAMTINAELESSALVWLLANKRSLKHLAADFAKHLEKIGTDRGLAA